MLWCVASVARACVEDCCLTRSSTISTCRSLGERTKLSSNLITYNIEDETIQESLCEILFYDHTQNVNLTEIRSKVVIWDNPVHNVGE